MTRKKQLMGFVARLFTKRKSRASLFADAIEEGIRDTVREMGYKPDHNSKKSKKANDDHGLL
ncbi:MAG TPA: hypothetical protein VFH08_06855 [Chitinophagaceae bacterium]|nr:hypothetical protein [Chitinophagaceae bacterium]